MCCIETDTIILTQFNSALLTSVRSGRAEPGRVGSGLVWSGRIGSGDKLPQHRASDNFNGSVRFHFPKIGPVKNSASSST